MKVYIADSADYGYVGVFSTKDKAIKAMREIYMFYVELEKNRGEYRPAEDVEADLEELESTGEILDMFYLTEAELDETL